jgi:hypothetical protein
VQGYRTVNISSTLRTVWYSICNIYLLLHVSTERSHHQGVIIAKVYNQHNNICYTAPNKLLIYVINDVSHSTCVGRYIDCKNRYSVNSRKLQNGWINMWTEGTVAVSEKDWYNWRPGAPHILETGELKWCWCNWLSGSSWITLGEDNSSSCIKSHELSDTHYTAAIMFLKHILIIIYHLSMHNLNVTTYLAITCFGH